MRIASKDVADKCGVGVGGVRWWSGGVVEWVGKWGLVKFRFRRP